MSQTTKTGATQHLSSIIALNLVSALSQVGQFGLGTTLIPIALEAKMASPETIGLTTSAFWFGMLFGLFKAGYLTRKLGYRNTVLIGLLLSALSFFIMPLLDWHWWAIPAALIGVGLGYRWIANETWLYRLAPIAARGRIVGIHETLISVAAIAGPMIIIAYGAESTTSFWIASALILLSIPGLYFAHLVPAVTDDEHAKHEAKQDTIKTNTTWFKSTWLHSLLSSLKFWLAFGAIIAGLGGWIEGSLLAFLPMYTSAQDMGSNDAAILMTIIGVGATVWQFPLGWLADHRGVLWTAKLTTFLGTISVILVILFTKVFWILAVAVFFLGGLIGGMLTLGLIWATQHSSSAEMTKRVWQVSIVYTTFSASGPFASGYIIGMTNVNTMFWQHIVVLALIGFALKRENTREKQSINPMLE
jgi:MFS family permease